MGRIEWSMWANEQALASAWVTLLGGILSVAGHFPNWQIGIYAIALGCFTFLLEYPRGKREKGTSYERKLQWPLAVIVSKGKLLTRNYFIRFVFHLAVSVPCCFILPTLLGAVCYMITGIIYLVAATRGEEWQQIPREKKDQGPKVIEQPNKPPPRRPEPQVTNEGPEEENRV